MPAKKKTTRKAKPAARSTKSAKAGKESAPSRSSAELHFTEATIIRGEAVEHGDELPSGATHEIAGHDAAGQPILKRKRFSIC
jgi:hypothetical protein